MKKFWKGLAVCGLVGCVCASAIGFNAVANADTLSSFTDATVAYNELYAFKAKDENGNLLTYTVKNSAGVEVPVHNYTFAVTETGAYTVTVTLGKESKSYKLTPQDVSAPILRLKKDVQRVNVLKGEKAGYPEVLVSDNADSEVEISYAVTFNGEAYESESDGFTPTELGFYTLTVSAKDDSNNIATKTVLYESVATVEETYKVFAFDEDPTRYLDYVGMNKTVLEYNTDAKYVYGNEKGSTRMSFIADSTPLFCVKNQLMDTTEFDYIRFYVYNAHSVKIGLGVNVATKIITLEPGVWTEVIIDSWESAFTPNMDHSNITGMGFMFTPLGDYSDQRFGYKGDLYFSAAYGVKA